MANSRPIDNPANLGLGETGCTREGLWYAKDWQGRVSRLTNVPGSMVRVIGGTNRVVVPSANNAGGSTSIKDAADLITNTTNFAGKLSATDINVQLALDTLDDHVHVHSTNTSLTADDHTQYALLLGRAGGQSLSGGDAANDDLTLQGTTHATRTTSYVLLQPNGGNVGVGTATPSYLLHGVGTASGSNLLYFTDATGSYFTVTTDSGNRVQFLAYGTGVSAAGAYFTANGYQETYFNIVTRSNTSGQQWIRFGNKDNIIKFDRLSDTGASISTTNIFAIECLAPANSLYIRATTGNVGLGMNNASARLHLPAGTATASSGPLKFTSGVSLTSPEAGALEFTTDSLYFTITTGPTRKTIAYTTDIPILVGETRRILLNRWNGNPSTTDGSAAWAWVESGGNADIPYSAFGFAGTTYLEFQTELPDDYGGGTVTAIVKWMTSSADANVVQWSVDARVFHDGDAINGAFGTAQVVTDTNQGASLVHVTAATPAITIAGTPAAGDMLSVRVARTPGEAADTLDAEVRLISVQLIYTVA